MTGSALDWICSYLEARSTFVRWKQNSSDVVPLDTGVPQGSSLGPFHFLLYIALLSAVINWFGVSHHQYADDTQVYIAVSRADVSDKVDLLQDCTAGIHSWLQMNGLHTQPNQVWGNSFHSHPWTWRSRWHHFRRCVECYHSTCIEHSKPGVTLDRKLSFDQISPVLTLAYFITATFCFYWLCTVSENKYSLICSTFTGTLNQLHCILLFIFHLISFFSFFMSF